MLSSDQATYKYPLLLSVALHAILIIALLVDIAFHHNPAVFAKGNQKVELIQAVAVNQQKLTDEWVKAKAAQQQRVIAAQQRKLDEQKQLAEAQQQAQAAAKLKAAAEAQQQTQAAAKLKAAAEAQQQAQAAAKLKATAEAQQQAQAAAKLKAVAEAQQQAQAAAKLKAAAEARQQAQAAAKLKALALAKQKTQAAAKLKAVAEAKRKALAAAAAEEAKLQQELATKEVQAAQVQGEVNKYQALIKHAIEQQWIVPPHVDKSLTCKFQIQLAPGGAVMNVTLLRSSGDPVHDRSAQTAIYKASPLPVPSDKDAFEIFRSFVVNVKPEEALDS